MNKLVVFLFLILLVTISCSRNKNYDFLFIQSQKYIQFNSDQKRKCLDSLELISKSLPNDIITRHFLFDLAAEYYFLNQLQKSFKVSKRVFQLSSDVKDSLGIAKSLYYMGDCYEITQKDSAYFYYQKAEKLYRWLGNKERIGRMLFNKGYLLFYDGNYLESEILVSKALQLLKKSDDIKLKFTCYNLIGTNFEKLEEFRESLKYYLLAKELLNDLTEHNNDFDQKNSYKITLSVNIANIYEKRLQYSKAEKELESILTTDLKEKWPKDYSTVIGNLGYVKTKLGNLKDGEALMKEALVLSRKSGIKSSIVYKLHNLGKYYIDTKDTLQAILYLKESLQLAEKLKSTDDVKINLQLLSTIDKTNTSYYDKRYITVSDSLTKVQRKNRNKYARIEYETSVVEDANKELSSRNLYLIVGVVVLAGALGIRYVLGQRKELAYRKQLQAAELELFDLMRSSQIALNRAKEEEQNRISRELHDNVMNKIYGARLQLGMYNTMTSLEAEEKRSKQIDNLQLIEQDIRSIAHDLYSDMVSHFDFSELLASCVQQANATTEFHLDCDERIDWESISGLVKITIYRIVQEALSNVAKYADASQCFVTITQLDATSLRLTVIDNGKGFDMSQTTKGIGLKNMSTRARAVKAELNIYSLPEQGTTIQCRFEV
ncbi:sensor histidine kinase [Flavobacterium sp.]|uniref:tetratricopeptide repeat-containing sensor histidine kinase n=1 Tax=Flavobacterium sp. TaxID=239 RepID=UPI0025D77C54|nr:sensor histidine kinase [Flavobacterium sp.]